MIQQRRRPLHKPWTQKNRILLCLLKRSYERKQIASIWSHIFRTRLAIEGFADGIPITTLDAQYQEMKTGGAGYEIYVHIDGATQNLIEKEYQAHLEEIRQAIRDLGLGITVRSTKLPKSVRSQNSRHRPEQRRAVSVPFTIVSELGSEPVNDTNVRPGIQQFTYHGSPYFAEAEHLPAAMTSIPQTHEGTEILVPPILKINTDNNGNTVQSHPLLLFRATPTVNKFVSRKFVEGSTAIPSPPVFGSADFKDIVWPHLQRDRSYKSPFISLAQNPRNALRRVEIAKSEEAYKKIFLVVFSFNDLQADAENKFEIDSGPYLVRNLFTAKEISDLPDGYKGSGEWLVYGSIDCEPIAILDSSQSIKLAKSLRHFKGGDAAALLDIGECLHSVPKRWKEAVSYNFLLRYCGRSHLPVLGSQPYKLLMQVIHNGQTSSLARLVAHCERSATEDVESRWILIQKQGDVVIEGEDEEAEAEADNPSELDDEELTPIRKADVSIALRCPVQVNVIQRSQLSSRSMFDRLNILGTRGNDDFATKPQRADSTPMWSTDSEDGNGPLKPCETSNAGHPIAERELSHKTAKFCDDWDIIEDDSQTSFLRDRPSAARKPRRTRRVQVNTQHLVPSIENDDHIDTFTAELLKSAYESSPVSNPRCPPQQPVKVQPGKLAFVPSVFSNTFSAASIFIDLTHDPTTQAATTDPKPSRKNRRRAVVLDDSDDSDDIIIAGSGRRQRIRLPMRSLSVQEAETIDGDEDFMSASEAT